MTVTQLYVNWKPEQFRDIISFFMQKKVKENLAKFKEERGGQLNAPTSIIFDSDSTFKLIHRMNRNSSSSTVNIYQPAAAAAMNRTRHTNQQRA